MIEWLKRRFGKKPKPASEISKRLSIYDVTTDFTLRYIRKDGSPLKVGDEVKSGVRDDTGKTVIFNGSAHVMDLDSFGRSSDGFHKHIVTCLHKPKWRP